MNNYTYVKARVAGTQKWEYLRFGSAFTESETLDRLSRKYGLRDAEFITRAEYVIKSVPGITKFILLELLKCLPGSFILWLAMRYIWDKLFINCILSMPAESIVDYWVMIRIITGCVAVVIVIAIDVMAEKVRRKRYLKLNKK